MTDVTHEISTVARSVGRRTLEAGEARVLTISRTYPTDQADLWDACTTPERIARWFLPVTGELRVGGRYQLEGNAGGVVERCEAPHGFAATWEMGDEVSWVTVRLEPEGDGRTRFTLEHLAHVDDVRWAEFGPAAAGIGWDLGLLGLERHLPDPASVVDEAAFTATDEGRVFMAAAGREWGEAAVAAGDDPAAARAAAERTVGFYSG